MDDFDRDVYCLAGLPFDAVGMFDALAVLTDAARNKTRCFFSTPNLNFLIASRSDTEFRDSVIHSDLVIADGMPLIWMARLLGIPIRERVAGSSLFEAMHKQDPARPVSVYFFGGPDGVAERAAREVNRARGGLTCVGFQSPGFATVEEMSAASRIDHINASAADFLVVALGAKKGQAYIYKNLARFQVPIISHLGAVVNFEAGILKRAPVLMQNLGLEWLWRIKEEPKLWRRYWHDGLDMLTLFATLVLPHAFWLMRNRRHLRDAAHKNNIHFECDGTSCRLMISGFMLDPVSADTRSMLRQINLRNKDVVLDLANAEYLSPGFLGLLLLLRKHLDKGGKKLDVVGVRPEIQRLLKWNGWTDFAPQACR